MTPRTYPTRPTPNAGPNPRPIPEGACDTCGKYLDENQGLAVLDELYPKVKIWRYCDDDCESSYDGAPMELDT